MQAQEFLTQLDREIHQHPFLSSDFVKAMSRGRLDRSQGQCFARLYYPHILRTRLYQANALGIAEDETVQFVLADILHDEYGNGDMTRTHMEVYRKFMRAVGVTEGDIQAGGETIPELALYIDSMMRLSQHGDWLAAAAAVGIASEWPIPAFYRLLLQGLRTLPGITDDELELFVGHIELDVEHSRMMRDALLPYADSSDGQRRIRAGVRANLDARHVFLNGLYREVFQQPVIVGVKSA